MNPISQVLLTLLVIPLGLFLLIYSAVVMAITHSVECIQGDWHRRQKFQHLQEARKNGVCPAGFSCQLMTGHGQGDCPNWHTCANFMPHYLN